MLIVGLLVFGYGAVFGQQEQGLPGLWWDDRAWTPIVVPQGTMFCRVSEEDSTRMKCLAIPPGSLLILPVPQEDK